MMASNNRNQEYITLEFFTEGEKQDLQKLKRLTFNCFLK